LLAFDLDQMQFVLVIKQRCPPVTHLHSLYVIFALNLVDLFPA
jgi:hypothetical protein